MKKILFSIWFIFFVLPCLAGSFNNDQKKLLALYRQENNHGLLEASLKLQGNAVAVLTGVMKDKSFPDRNRWMATTTLAQMMGHQSLPLLKKYIDHPDWIMRMAALQAMTYLGYKEDKKVYQKALNDSSLLVRSLALDSVKKLSLRELEDDLLKMMFDQKNYQQEKAGKHRRGPLISKVIRTLGEIKSSKAQRLFTSMQSKRHFGDLRTDLDYAISRF